MKYSMSFTVWLYYDNKEFQWARKTSFHKRKFSRVIFDNYVGIYPSLRVTLTSMLTSDIIPASI
jgi:hypothetical protein